MSSDRRKPPVIVTLLIAGAVAIFGFVVWRRDAPRRWTQMSQEEEQALKAADREIAVSFANVSEEETLPVRQRLERAMAESNPSLVADDLDVEALLRIVLVRLDIAGEEARRLRSQFSPEVYSPEAFAEELLAEACRDLQTGGSYRLLRLRVTDEKTIALYRLLTPQGTVNYHEWMFARGDDGRVRIADVFIYGAGERLSETLASRFLMLRVGEKGLSRVERIEAERLAEKLQLAFAAAHTGDIEAFDDRLAGLPSNVRNEKSVLTMQVMAASRLSDPDRATGHLRRLRELYPNDASGDVLGWPVDSANGNHDAAIAALDRLDERVGGDPMLALIRAEEHVAMKRFSEAKADLAKAIEDEDALAAAHFLLVYVSAAEGEYDEAASWARKYADRTNSSPQELFDRFVVRRDEVWDAFRRSEAWQTLTDESQSP